MSITGQQTKFTIEGATKEGTQNVRPAFVKYVTDMKADGNDPDLVLRPRNDNYRIVIINSVLHTKQRDVCRRNQRLRP